MTKKNEKTSSKKMIKSLVGCLAIVIGITLILLWVNDVKIFFRAITGMLCAGSGMLLLYSLKK